MLALHPGKADLAGKFPIIVLQVCDLLPSHDPLTSDIHDCAGGEVDVEPEPARGAWVDGDGDDTRVRGKTTKSVLQVCVAGHVGGRGDGFKRWRRTQHGFPADAGDASNGTVFGWKVLPARFDDGGISGGTLDRPALQRLMAEVDAGRIDMNVVYKIDRLTRSLADFARLVERLDRAGASFVSVTHAFNTSTSMGRLTLNVLLSFAQFEREVTAERINPADRVRAG